MAHPRVTYSVACAGAIGLRAASVDLVVAAQAAHWFDLTAFFADARRLLKPDGVVALVSYGRIVVEGPCGAPVSHLYSDVLRPFWPAERRHVDNGYRDLEFPFAELKAPCLAIERTWAIDELVGYIRTWSAIEVAARQGHGDVVEAAIEAIRGASGSPSNPISVRWPLATRVGRVDTR
jgi:SAM-dependent methyltransferase